MLELASTSPLKGKSLPAPQREEGLWEMKRRWLFYSVLCLLKRRGRLEPISTKRSWVWDSQCSFFFLHTITIKEPQYTVYALLLTQTDNEIVARIVVATRETLKGWPWSASLWGCKGHTGPPPGRGCSASSYCFHTNNEEYTHPRYLQVGRGGLASPLGQDLMVRSDASLHIRSSRYSTIMGSLLQNFLFSRGTVSWDIIGLFWRR